MAIRMALDLSLHEVSVGPLLMLYNIFTDCDPSGVRNIRDSSPRRSDKIVVLEYIHYGKLNF